MWAKVVVGEIDPGRVEVATEAVAGELIPHFQGQPGACRGHWMADRATGHVLAVTLWSDPDLLEAARATDGERRAQVAERIGLDIRAVQTMKVLGAHDPDLTESPVSRWVRATWVEASPILGVPLRALHESVVPYQARSAGFCGSYWLGEPTTGHGLALSFWDGPAAVGDSEGTSGRRRRWLEQMVGWRVSGMRRYEALGVATHATADPRPLALTGA